MVGPTADSSTTSRFLGFARACASLVLVLVLAPGCQTGGRGAVSSTPTPIGCPAGVGAAAPDGAAAARCLYQAWAAGHRDQAAVFASLDVVATLFTRPSPPPDATFQGCFETPGTGARECSLARAGTTYRFAVRPSEGGWRVTQAFVP